MELAEAGENFLLKRLRTKFGKLTPGLLVGIGDDAAVVAASASPALMTTDMMVEGVHFDLRWTTPFQIGYKLVSVNVSDIYAMGGIPAFLLLNFSAVRSFTLSRFDDLFRGIAAASRRYGTHLIGGDISSSPTLMLSATVIGYASEKILKRSGARVGDYIHVTGTLGDSACGLELLKKMKRPIPDKKVPVPGRELPVAGSLPLLRRHVMPVAKKPDSFVGRATAMMDVSDGLVLDLSRLCADSRVGARIYAEKLPLSRELISAAAYLKKDPLDFALGGGEDYELLFTSATKKIAGASCIGEITKSGIRVVDHDGSKREISGKGYQHFAY
ncbi:MAG: thiamine-phosphate kinase [Thermodesulfovibrionales bacterium]